MNKNLKIGLIILTVLGVSAGAYFAIKFYNLREAYKKSLPPEDVLKIVDEKAQDLGTEMEEDPDLKTSYQEDISGGSEELPEEDYVDNSEYE